MVFSLERLWAYRPAFQDITPSLGFQIQRGKAPKILLLNFIYLFYSSERQRHTERERDRELPFPAFLLKHLQKQVQGQASDRSYQLNSGLPEGWQRSNYFQSVYCQEAVTRNTAGLEHKHSDLRCGCLYCYTKTTCHSKHPIV